MQQLFAVIFVLLSLWGAVFFLRRKGIAVWNTPSRKQAPCIQQLDKLRLSPQHSIHLLQIENRRLVVAVHNQGITVIETGSSQSGYATLAGGAAAQ